MKWIKWLFTSKYKKLLAYIDAQFSNKGGLWIHTDKNSFRLDFENMKIEHVMYTEDEE